MPISILGRTDRPGEQFYWALLRLGDTSLMLNTAFEEPDRPALPGPVRVAAHSDTAIFFGCPDVDAAFEHLRAQCVVVAEPPNVTGYGFRRMTVADPDGYHLCFHWPVEQQAA